MKTSVLIRLILSVVAIFTAGAVGTVGVMSILSDVVTDDGLFMATENVIVTDTLDIAGAYQVFANGSPVPDVTNDVIINAGDVAVIKATITNYGNASAWVRDSIVLSGASFLSIASGEHTASDFEDGTAWPSTGIYEFGGANETSTIYSTKTRVLNGTGTGAQIETEINAPPSLLGDVNYYPSMFIGSNSYDVAYSVYFDPDNDTTGGETVTFSAKSEALQYRDNNSAFPVVTCDSGEPPVCTNPWSVVVSSPTGL